MTNIKHEDRLIIVSNITRLDKKYLWMEAMIGMAYESRNILQKTKVQPKQNERRRRSKYGIDKKDQKTLKCK